MGTETMDLGQMGKGMKLQMLELSTGKAPVDPTEQALEMTDEELLSEIEVIMGPEAAMIEAAEHPQTLLEIEGRDGMDVPAMRFDMGLELLNQGYYYQARDIFTELFKQGYREYESLIHLGMAHRMLGDIVDAATCLNRALAIRTESSDAWYHLGVLLMDSEKPMLTEARAFLRQAFRLSPESEEISNSLQRCEMMMKGYTS